MQKCLKIKIRYLLVIGLTSLVLSSFCKHNQILNILLLFTGLFCFVTFFIIKLKKGLNNNTNTTPRIKPILKCLLLLLIFFLFLIGLYQEETYYFSKVLLFHFHEKFGYPFEKDYSSYGCEDCNIILISIDTLRADHLPCYGYYRNTAPNICAFARESILFENAFSQAPHTFPSQMSIFTSLYPISHGVRVPLKDHLDTGIFTLPQILKVYNYTTAWLGVLNCYSLDFEAGYGRGFDEFFDSPYKNLKNECNNTALFDWLDKQKDSKNKFFMFYHTYKVHEPYTPITNTFDTTHKLNLSDEADMRKIREDFLRKQHEAVREQFYKNQSLFFLALNISDEAARRKMVEEKKLNADFSDTDNISEPLFSEDEISTLERAGIFPTTSDIFWREVNKSDRNEVSYIASLYDSEILEVDSCLDKFLDKLEEDGFYNNSIVVITADHGEEFTEHGSVSHQQLYDETLHVPLIFQVPGIGRSRVKRLVESIDIMPTLLSLVAIPQPYYTQGKNLLNNSPNDFVYSEFNGMERLRSERWSFIMHDNGITELYDLIKDPKQTKNIAQEKTKTTEEMKTKLQNWLNTRPKYYKTIYDFDTSISNKTRESIIKTGYW